MYKTIEKIHLPDFGECVIRIYDNKDNIDFGIRSTTLCMYISISLINVKYTDGVDYLTCNDLEVLEEFMVSPKRGYKNIWDYILHKKCQYIKKKVPKNVTKPYFPMLKFLEGNICKLYTVRLSGLGECTISIKTDLDFPNCVMYIESKTKDFKTGLYIDKPKYYLNRKLTNKQLDQLIECLNSESEYGNNWNKILVMWIGCNRDVDDKYEKVKKPDYGLLKTKK